MRRPNLRDLSLNWTSSDLPFAQKVQRAIANNWKKLSTGSPCCGNHGEPGC